MHSESNLRIVSNACSVGSVVCYHKRKYFHKIFSSSTTENSHRHQPVIIYSFFLCRLASSTAISNNRRKGSWSFFALKREFSDNASGCDFKAHSLSHANKRCVKRRGTILQLFAQIVAAFFHSRLDKCVASLFHSRAHNVFIKRNIFVTQI